MRLMRLSSFHYYADYYLYGAVGIGLTVAALATTPLAQWDGWLLSFLIGYLVWTFSEYQLHRWILHHVPYVKDMHEAHHDDQKALIGTPGWLSLILMALIVFVPSVWLVGFTYGAGFTGGFIAGYFTYITVHHGVHHWRIRPGSIMYRLKRRHALHHHFDDMGNFGVTSGLWDKVFRTDIKVRREAAVAGR